MEEKLEIIKLRENGVSSSTIGKDRNMAESSVRTIYNNRKKLKFQATMVNPSQNRTRSMDKMESLLSLWIQDLDKRGIIIGIEQIQAKAKSLYLLVKETFQDKTEAEIKETFVASNGWLQQFKLRHDIKNLSLSGKAKSAIHVKKKEHKCEICHQNFPFKNDLINHIKTVHEDRKRYLDRQIKAFLTETEVFKCKDCNKGFLSKKTMEIHEKQVHQKIKPSQRYICNECKASFEKKQQMEWHITSVHLDKKPYKCNLCVESFFIDSQLKQHLKKTHRICGEKISLFE